MYTEFSDGGAGGGVSTPRAVWIRVTPETAPCLPCLSLEFSPVRTKVGFAEPDVYPGQAGTHQFLINKAVSNPDKGYQPTVFVSVKCLYVDLLPRTQGCGRALALAL